MIEIRCLIVEDQLPAQRILETYISQLDHLKLVGVCQSATEAIKLLQNNDVDLIFLDIHLPKMDGFSFLKTFVAAPNIIVTTAYSEYALEAFELNVLDYLLKPFSFERFCGAISKVNTPPNTNKRVSVSHDTQTLFIKVDGDFIRLETDNLVHIASDGNFLHINMKDTRYYILGTLQSWLDKLPNGHFIRVQKSHIVNMRHVEKISGNLISTCVGPIPIGRAYKEALLRKTIDT